jgi:hypothetical protein
LIGAIVGKRTNYGDLDITLILCTISLNEALMRGHPLGPNPIRISTLMERAVAGVPQRVPRQSKEAVVIASEVDRLTGPKRSPSLADLFLRTVGEAELVDAIGHRSLTADERPFSADFADRMPLCDTSIASCLMLDAFFEATMSGHRQQKCRMRGSDHGRRHDDGFHQLRLGELRG